MAGDWIKVEHTLPSKPEVSLIADTLGISEDEVVGKLVRLWVWADQHTSDGNLPVPHSTIDRRVSCPGFAAAMLRANWLEGDASVISLPRFDRHNGDSAKKRVDANRRVAEHRKRECNKKPLQKALPEKRREEVLKREKEAGCEFPSAADVLAHGATLMPPADPGFCEWWWNVMEGGGWTNAVNGTSQPVHPKSWKQIFNAAHSSRRHKEQQEAARRSTYQPTPKPKPRGPNI